VRCPKKRCNIGVNNPNYGKHETEKTKLKISVANSGSQNGMWKGDKVGYFSIHDWARKRKPKPNLCENCDQQPPRDLANISGLYLRDINDYRWLCRKCHMRLDGRMKNLKQFKGAAN
jgi:hypothetical protein